MYRLKYDDYIRKLDNDFRLADSTTDFEIQSVLAKFICIRLCGLVEVGLKELIQNFVDNRKTHSIISSYISDNIRNITNLKSDKLRCVLSNFSKDWAAYYDDNITEEMKSSLGSVYVNRNEIAHGGNVSVSLRQLKDDYVNLKKVANILKDAIQK
jgi:hypothetical protein